MQRLVLVCSVAWVAGCTASGTGQGTSSSGGVSTCVPGSQQVCACGGNRSGFQVCQSDGTFGACQACEAASSSMAGGSSGASTTSSLSPSSGVASSAMAGQTSSAVSSMSQGSTSSGTASSRGVIFHSDWGTALGTSASAKSDGNRWTIVSDNLNALEVISCASLGFPTPNCLRVTALEAQGGYGRLAVQGLGVPDVGQSYWYRWYYRSEIGSTGDNSTHPIESGQAGGLDWSFNVEVQSDTQWRPELRPGGDQMDVNRARWTGPLLDRSVLYRFELQVHKISMTEFRAHIRVYDATGALIADDDDFNNYITGLGANPQQTLADAPTLHFATMGGTNLDEWRAGNNGIMATGYDGDVFAYQGGFALCGDDWCGPWRDGI